MVRDAHAEQIVHDVLVGECEGGGAVVLAVAEHLRHPPEPCECVLAVGTHEALGLGGLVGVLVTCGRAEPPPDVVGGPEAEEPPQIAVPSLPAGEPQGGVQTRTEPRVGRWRLGCE